MTTEVSEAQGRPVNHKRIERLMREHGLQSHKRRRFRVVTTDSKRAHPVAPNVLERNFKATRPNHKWLADLTYVPTDEGWLYLALVLDLHARKLVGWAMSETMPQELTLCALDVALGWRDPDAGLLHHSDRGSQYAAKGYQTKLKARGITVSMSRKGDCWDNAPMESVNGTLKVECVHDAPVRRANDLLRLPDAVPGRLCAQHLYDLHQGVRRVQLDGDGRHTDAPAGGRHEPVHPTHHRVHGRRGEADGVDGDHDRGVSLTAAVGRPGGDLKS